MASRIGVFLNVSVLQPVFVHSPLFVCKPVKLTDYKQSLQILHVIEVHLQQIHFNKNSKILEN